MPWFVPLIMSLVSTAVGAGTSIANTKKQIAAQKQFEEEEQLLKQEALNDERIRLQQQQQHQNQINNQQIINQLNKGYSTGTTGNQMGAGIGVGVQGLNTTGYLNEDSLMAEVGGLFSKKVNTKNTVRDNNNLYFDRIEYAKCGGRFKENKHK